MDRLESFAVSLVECVSTAWDWLAGLDWKTFVATVAGAVVAFALERERRHRERVSRECARANALIATLARIHRVLEKLNVAVPPLKDGKPTAESYEPVTGIPANLPSIEFRDLDFMLETDHADDPCVAAYNRIALVQDKFDGVLAKLAERNELARRCQETRPETMFGRGEGIAPTTVRFDTLIEPLNFFAHELVASIPAVIRLTNEAVVELRSALVRRYPRRQFMDPFRERSKRLDS
jgi:hypothetical protein